MIENFFFINVKNIYFLCLCLHWIPMRKLFDRTTRLGSGVAASIVRVTVTNYTTSFPQNHQEFIEHFPKKKPSILQSTIVLLLDVQACRIRAFQNPNAHRYHQNSHVAVREKKTLSTSEQYCILIG